MKTPIECRALTQWSNNAPVINNVSCSSETQMTFVYRRALLMVPGEEHDLAVESQQHSIDDSDFSAESSAILYNMALTHHLMGLATNRSDVLERALKFYEISNNIRQNKDDKDLDILDLAIANNVGQAQHEFCNYGTARECFDLLTRRLQLFNTYGMICLLAQCDCEGFVLNAMLEQPTMAAAA
eukprot:CAMPEP_0202451198 /NCGR_PEP_ID=MMETSP1360-20130828/9680_1 /ASSEMBLY_ACC=CAM_ASM_000848 /TAXON_ID=515479 /ORGANISM="Licmophora paradoxa, Strain CCMP2313" /LENGTH=183 /DNA_ID=CAMNT_0049069705 /DNA_START=88 /DNA_END=636 /DNA_ORIENTATION=+